jgi:hypothetical protein
MIDLDDSIMITEYDNYLDVTFNSGGFVRLHRCGETATFPAGTVVELAGTPDQMLIGVPRDVWDFFESLTRDGGPAGGLYLLHDDDFDLFLDHIKAGGERVGGYFPDNSKRRAIRLRNSTTTRPPSLRALIKLRKAHILAVSYSTVASTAAALSGSHTSCGDSNSLTRDCSRAISSNCRATSARNASTSA